MTRCLKCQGKVRTLHSTGLCADCRTHNCRECGVTFRGTSRNLTKTCSQCRLNRKHRQHRIA